MTIFRRIQRHFGAKLGRNEPEESNVWYFSTDSKYMFSDHVIAHIGQYGLIMNKRNQVLVLERIEIKKSGLPGGRLEEGEKLHESLFREIKEESNIDCASARPFAVQLALDGSAFKYCVYFIVSPKFPLSVCVDDKTIWKAKWISAKTAAKTKFFNDNIKKVILDFFVHVKGKGI